MEAEHKVDAIYLFRFIAACSIGLFDADLNYVWNEVVTVLRGKTILYGIDEFFDSAVGANNRSRYSKEEDLERIKDKTMLNTLYKPELIDKLLEKRLLHILDMRNNAGASHPNLDGINAYELAAWLKTCVDDVITIKPSPNSYAIKKIIDKIKNKSLFVTDLEVEKVENTLKEMSSTMRNNFLSTLFGIYINPKTDIDQRSIIVALIEVSWSCSTKDKKYDIANKVAIYDRNFEDDKAKLGDEFLEMCDGKSFYPQDEK